ncbi:MAG: hypothetical protein CSA84_07500 [Actinomycetales bacterium]|nr:MAG: hypothetical protein CSA84_07500 [Actinomycetales bacterium]
MTRTVKTWLRWVAIPALVLLVGALLVWSKPSGDSDEPLHPGNPGFKGARAVARVLADHGVEVIVAEGANALARAGVDDQTTVVVSYSADLREATALDLREQASVAERLVLIDPERRVVRALLPQVAQRTVPRIDVVSGCDTGDTRSSERLGRTVSEYRDGSARDACFVTDDYAVYLSTSASRLRDVVLIGSTDTIANDRITEADNAALAVRALGHSPRLVWYVPDLRDVPPNEAARDDTLYPTWWAAFVLLVFLCVAAVMWWRGRRFGRLVTEPLPVVIRAIETTESRGRMYHRAQDASWASTALREATRRRISSYLGIPVTRDAGSLADAVAGTSGWPRETVQYLLHGPPATTDAELLKLAADLTALEKEIHHR